MSEHSVQYGSFTIERRLDASPARVFAAWSNPEAKAAWFGAPKEECVELKREFNFRVGGEDRLSGKWIKHGRTSHFHNVYFDIVENERIVYAYDMHIDDKKISVSLATIEFKPAGKGTLLVLREDGAFLDGFDDNGGREHGTKGLVEKLAHYVEG